MFTSDGCTACHSISGQRGIGPPLNGVAGSRVPLTTGQTVVADNAYLTRSIDNPDAQIVRGFQPGIMSATIRPGSINATDTASLVAYIQSLR